MDPKQLELDLRPCEDRTKSNESSEAVVVSLEQIRSLKRQLNTDRLFKAIISSVDHILPPQKFK